MTVMLPFINQIQNYTTSFIWFVVIGALISIVYFIVKKNMPNKKHSIKYDMEEEILSNEFGISEYGASSNEVSYNKELNARKIRDIKSLHIDTKLLLINNSIETVGDLKYSSLDFLLDFSEDSKREEHLKAFYDCKDFIKKSKYKNGQSTLNL